MIFRISKRRIVVAAACELVLIGGMARAGQLFWDGGNAPFPPANGGSGTWDDGFSPNWATDSSGSGYTTWDNTNPSDAVFDVTPGTVTINSASNVTATSVLLNVNSYIISGSGSLTLTGAGTIGVTGATNTGTIATRIAGSVGLTKVGAGSLNLTGNNTYTGTTNANGGTIVLLSAGALPSGNGLSLAGGLLNVGSFNTSITSLSLNNGTITGTGSVLTSGTISYTGATPVSIGGLAQVGAPILFSSAPTVDVAALGNGTINTTMTATGTTFTKTGAGTLNLTINGTNSYTKTVVNNGTLAIVVDRNFGDVPGAPTADAVTLNGGAIRATSNSTWVPNSNRGFFIDAGGGTLDASFSSGTVVFGATITGTGQFTKTGITTVASTNPGSNFSGGLLVNQGRWNTQVTGASGTGLISLAPIGTSSVNFGIGLTNAGATPVVSNNITLVPGTGTVSFEVNNSTPVQNVLTLTGVISGNSDLVKGQVAATNGVLVITNPGNNYTGATKVLLGTLRTAANNTGLPSTSNLLLTGGGIYETSGAFTRALGTGGNQLQIGAGSGGFSAFGGALAVDIGGNGSGTGPQLVFGAGNFNPANTLILNGATADSTLTFYNALDMGATNRTIQANAATAIANGVISGSAGLTKAGAGTLQLAANNNFTGGFTVSVGTLAISNDNNLGALANTGTLAGASTLKFLAAVPSARNMTVNPGGGNVDTNGFNSSLGAFSGAGTLTKLGTGNLTVTNLRNQGITVNVGTVSIAAGRNTANTSSVKNVTVAGGAGLDLHDQDLVADTSGMTFAQLQTLITNGYNSNAWNGSGINSSTAAANNAVPANHTVAIGYGDNAVLGYGPTFSGVNVGPTSLLARYTYAGDANLDGSVDTVDFNLLAANFSQSGKNWTQGDFNYDGSVDSVDFNLLASNFGQTLPGAAGPSLGSLVPEPATLSMLSIGLAGLLRRRRSRT